MYIVSIKLYMKIMVTSSNISFPSESLFFFSQKLNRMFKTLENWPKLSAVIWELQPHSVPVINLSEIHKVQDWNNVQERPHFLTTYPSALSEH